jgi:hypothetical protein
MRQFSAVQPPTGNKQNANTAEPYPSLEELPLLENTYSALYRKAKINEGIYEALMQQYELAKVQEAKEIPSIKVLDQPVLPEHKVFPPRKTIVFLGTLAFLAIGIALLFLQVVVAQMPEYDQRRLTFSQLLNSAPMRFMLAPGARPNLRAN